MVLSSVHLRLFVTTAAVVVLTAGLTFSNIMVSSHLRNPQLTGGAEPSGHISDIPVATAASSTHQLVSSMSRWPLKATDPEGTQAQALAAPATPQFVSFVNRTVVKDRLFVLSNVMLSDNELTIWGDGVLAAACSAWGDLVSACASGHGSASNYDLLNGTYWMMQASLHGDRNNPVPLKIKWQHEQPRCDVYFTESEPVVVLSPRHAPNAWHTMHETVLPLLDTLLHDSVQGLMMPTLESNNHRTEHHDIHHVPTEWLPSAHIVLYNGHRIPRAAMTFIDSFSFHPILNLKHMHNVCAEKVAVGLLTTVQYNLNAFDALPLLQFRRAAMNLAGMNYIVPESQAKMALGLIPLKQLPRLRTLGAGVDGAALQKPKLTVLHRPPATSLSRNILNMDDLISAMQANGWDVSLVDFGTLSVADTVHVMQETDVLFGAHGAGMTNIYYMRPGSAVVQYYPPDSIVNARAYAGGNFRGLAAANGVAMFDYRCRRKELATVPYDFLFSDFHVDIPRAMSALKLAKGYLLAQNGKFIMQPLPSVLLPVSVRQLANRTMWWEQVPGTSWNITWPVVDDLLLRE